MAAAQRETRSTGGRPDGSFARRQHSSSLRDTLSPARDDESRGENRSAVVAVAARSAWQPRSAKHEARAADLKEVSRDASSLHAHSPQPGMTNRGEKTDWPSSPAPTHRELRCLFRTSASTATQRAPNHTVLRIYSSRGRSQDTNILPRGTAANEILFYIFLHIGSIALYLVTLNGHILKPKPTPKPRFFRKPSAVTETEPSAENQNRNNTTPKFRKCHCQL